MLVQNNFKLKESTLLLIDCFQTDEVFKCDYSNPGGTEASLLFPGNIIDWSLSQVTKCGRLTNLITNSLPF